MTTHPTRIASHKNRIVETHDKYHDILVTYPDYFERNIIGLGYAFEAEVLCHHIAVGEIIAVIIELDGEFLLLAEFRFARKKFTYPKVLEWLETFDVHFEHLRSIQNNISNAESVITGVRFRDSAIVIFRKGNTSLSFSPEFYPVFDSDGNNSSPDLSERVHQSLKQIKY
jgi:hypothetical protein